MKVDKEKEIDELLSRGASSFVDPDGSFRQKLLENPEKVVIKLGVDPTRPDIHLGHAVILRKLRKFQELGCKVVFLIGDYTAQIGDPTGKSKVRPELEQKEIEANMKTYLDQVGAILKLDPAVFSWIRNSDWFTAITDIGFPPGQKVKLALEQEGKKVETDLDANSFIGKALIFEQTRMQVKDLKIKGGVSVVTLKTFLWGLRHITHSRLIARDMFQERIEKGEELYMHEMMYPVLQGIDSQVLAQIYGSCDLEVGGTDQTFNMLMGRDIMKINKLPQQAVLCFKLLIGTDGKEKMSKSLDNYIAITDEPNNMYGKIMSIPDSAIRDYFELCTFTPLLDVLEIEKKLSDKKTNPRDLKMRLGREIVAIYHGEAKAQKAEEDFINAFQKKEIPETVTEIRGEGDLGELLVENKIVESKSEWRRLIEGGAISNLSTEEKITDPKILAENATYKIGKHRFAKIIS